MTKLKLTYFDFPGSRGEECRLALYANGVDFEDNRIPPATWPELKPTTPFGGLPTLELPGKPVLAQSGAILAYIGREYGLHPTDPWEAARHEGIFAAVEDLRSQIGTTGHKDPLERKRRREAFAAGYLTHWATHVERQIRGPFLDGPSLHLADIKLFVILQALLSGTYDDLPLSTFDPFVRLVALHGAVGEHPKVAAWRNRSTS